jgi:hypothetical protein
MLIFKFHDNRRMNTSADVCKFKILQLFVKLLNSPWAGAGDLDLHFSLLSMGGFHRAEVATFQICRNGYLFFLFVLISFTRSR